MANILILDQPRIDVGLTTSTYTVGATPTNSTGAGFYNVQVQATELPPSGLTLVVNQNGSPIYTANAVTPTQIALQFKVSILCAAADVITVVATSSAANDQLLNTVKINTSIGEGA